MGSFAKELGKNIKLNICEPMKDDDIFVDESSEFGENINEFDIDECLIPNENDNNVIKEKHDVGEHPKTTKEIDMNMTDNKQTQQIQLNDNPIENKTSFADKQNDDTNVQTNQNDIHQLHQLTQIQEHTTLSKQPTLSQMNVLPNTIKKSIITPQKTKQSIVKQVNNKMTTSNIPQQKKRVSFNTTPQQTQQMIETTKNILDNLKLSRSTCIFAVIMICIGIIYQFILRKKLLVN